LGMLERSLKKIRLARRTFHLVSLRRYQSA
jgi:hypothetical protein